METLSAREDGFAYLTDMHMCVFNETFLVCGMQFVSSQHSFLRNSLYLYAHVFSFFRSTVFFIIN